MFDKILKEAGISAESLDKIRLGPGVVGRSATVAVAALIVLAVAAYKINNDYFLFAIVILVVLIFAGFFWGAMRYADRNPAAALLEGAELVTWRKQELAAKNVPHLPDSPVITDPRPPSIGEIESVK